jgi:hypothetical protein
VPIDRGAVTVAYLHPNDVAHSWHESMTSLVGYDLGAEQRIIRGGWIGMKCGAGGLDRGRTLAVAQFLDERDAEWLFWVDADMGFAPDTIDRLLAVADPVERPLVGGLCFALKETEQDGMGGFRTAARPTLFDWVTDGQGRTGFQGRSHYPVNTLVQVQGTGSACLLVHRSVFERIAQEHGPVWYNRIPNPSTGDLIGEDLSFCVRAGSAGIPIWVHTGVRTTHQKTLWLGEQDFWRQRLAPPAAEPIAVLLPLAGRPEHARPFMQSLKASTGLATVYGIVDMANQDLGETWQAEGARIVWVDASPEGRAKWAAEQGYTQPWAWDDPAADRPSTFSEKLNRGVLATREPWMLVVGSDSAFRPGWWDHAHHVATTYKASVIGTNDLGNPRVMAGEHATHPILSRTYIEDQGGSFDRPGQLAHEGYWHWFTDDEIVAAAKQRGAWQPALGCVIEHLHPAWGKAADDPVYALTRQHLPHDRELIQKRLAEHGARTAANDHAERGLTDAR